MCNNGINTIGSLKIPAIVQHHQQDSAKRDRTHGTNAWGSIRLDLRTHNVTYQSMRERGTSPQDRRWYPLIRAESAAYQWHSSMSIHMSRRYHPIRKYFWLCSRIGNTAVRYRSPMRNHYKCRIRIFMSPRQSQTGTLVSSASWTSSSSASSRSGYLP